MFIGAGALERSRTKSQLAISTDMTDARHILVVDDDPKIRRMLCGYLEDEGYRATGAENGQVMRELLARERFDLVILDLVMPGEDGLSLARDLRAQSKLPIIMVTGKGDAVDRVVGLEVGADDYITKPFHLREVLARMRAVLRRCGPATPPAATIDPLDDTVASPIGFAGWSLDPLARQLTDPHGEIVGLTSGEYELLAVFVDSANRVLSRDQLMDSARGRDWAPYDRAIDTLVSRLRKKIERDPNDPQLIKTVRGVGYVFAAKVTRG